MSTGQTARQRVISAAACLVAMCVVVGAEVAGERPENWRPVLADDFGNEPLEWETTAGEWTVANGRYTVEQPDATNALAYAVRGPFLQEQRIEATVVMRKRLRREDWSVAGALLFFDPSTFWVLALTEGSDGDRYVDFLESYQGVWQAQTEGKTRLTKTVEENMHFRWDYGKAYRLRLALDTEGITATVIDAAAGKTLATARYAFGKAEALRMGTVGLLARQCAATFDDVSVFAPGGRERSGSIAVRQGANGNVAILRDEGLPGPGSSVGDSLAAGLRAAGFGVTFLSCEQACDPVVLAPEDFFLYVIPHSEVYPAAGASALMTYLRRRGHLMVLGGPAFTRQVWKHDGQWVDMQIIRDLLAKQKAVHVFLDFDQMKDATEWTRATNAPAIASNVTLALGYGGAGKCLRYATADLSGWNTYASPALDGMFSKGHQLLCFRAKGDERTTQLSVEMNEADGSRWIAVVQLGAEWQHYVLSPDQFAYWPDSRTKKTRGGSGDRFNPARANRIVLGLASSHTPAVGGGPHTFWVDDFGTAPNPFADMAADPKQAFLPMETITPSYKVYPLEQVATVKVAETQTILDPALRLPPSASMLSPFARPMGQGFGNNGKWRWIPLARALDNGDVERGTPVWMLLNNAFPYKGSIFAAVGVQDPVALAGPELTQAMVAVARRIRHGVFLREAGARYFSYWPDEAIELSAEVVNLGAAKTAATLRISLTAAADGRSCFTQERRVDLRSGSSASATWTWKPTRHDGDRYRVKTELLEGGKVIDVISHELGILPAQPAARDEFVTVKGSDFYLNGKKWYPVGINFWPVYVSGSEPGDYSLGWLTPGFYDPDELERDLKRMADLGINMVSVQMGRPDNIRNLLDFMRRCGKHGIKVNGFLGTASPLGFDEAGTRAFIEEAKLTGNATLFTYDIIWEPGNSVFRGDSRPRWDGDWERWIVERYGSVENAEADWRSAAPRADGKVTSPSDRQMREDGDWRAMVAAYRRFMDDLMSRKWNDATRRLREIDPNHLVSFRQGNTLPQDFTFTATPKHIDFIQPEGYAIPLSEDGYDASGFITRYVHFTTGGKPIIWSEFGKSVWDRTNMEPVDSAIDTQAEYHEQFYRMVVESGANGTAPWWWPGGYRVNEKSDYGITNPDGTPRPSAELIRKYARRMKTPRDWPEPDTWLTLDRDAHPGGYWHLTFNEGKDAYRAARKSGKHLGIRTKGTGTDSTNCPLVAIGNTPYNGKNPPKYLNAEFNWLQIRDADGKWVEAQDGMEITVTANTQVLCRVSVGNTQEAKWLTPQSANGKPGAVCLASTAESGVAVKRPIPADTSCLSDADFGELMLTDAVAKRTSIELQLTAQGRAWFGEKRTFVLNPRER